MKIIVDIGEAEGVMKWSARYNFLEREFLSELAMSNSEFVQRFCETLPLFRGLTPQQISVARSVLRLREVRAGHSLMLESEPGDLVYIIAQGSVKICAHNGERDVVIAVRGAGEIVGEMSVLDGQARSATVIAQELSLVFWVSRTDFWSVLWEMPPITYNLTCLLAQRVRVLTSQVQSLSSLDVQGRLARQIVTLADEYGQPIALAKGGHGERIPFSLKQAELASMIGASREQVNKLLSNWTRRGLICRDGSQLVVVRRPDLKKLYQCDVRPDLEV